MTCGRGQKGFLTLIPGKTVDPSFIAGSHGGRTRLASIFRAVAYDRWRIEDLKRELAAIGIGLASRAVFGGQGFKDMSPAIDVLESAMGGGYQAYGIPGNARY